VLPNPFYAEIQAVTSDKSLRSKMTEADVLRNLAGWLKSNGWSILWANPDAMSAAPNNPALEWLDLRQLTITIASAPAAELPRMLWRLRELEATALARMYAVPSSTEKSREPEQLLDIAESAKRLNVSEDYLYRHWKKLPFAHKYDWGLRFSARGSTNTYETAELPCTLHAITDREGSNEPRRWSRLFAEAKSILVAILLPQRQGSSREHGNSGDGEESQEGRKPA
jgi:hypothetical protein